MHAHGLAGGHGPQPGSLEREDGHAPLHAPPRAPAQPSGHAQYTELGVLGEDLRRELRDEVAGQPPGFVVAAW